MTHLALTPGYETSALLRTLTLTGEVHAVQRMAQVTIPLPTLGGKVYAWLPCETVAEALWPAPPEDMC